jgi:diacylglycerol kinase (ATP)
MYYFILNPIAGNGRLNKIQNKLKHQLSSLNLVGEFMKTAGEGDAENLARIAVKKGYSTVICVGGDQTINEVLNGIAGNDITLGIIPIGENNSFAKKINIPSDYTKAIKLISARYIYNFDVGKIIENREYFLMSSGTGAENFLCMRTKDNFLNKSLLKTFLEGFVPVKMRFIIDKSYAITKDILTASIINSTFIKSNYLENINFNSSDGLLDLVLFGVNSKANINKILKDDDIFSDIYNLTRIKAREIHIESFEEQMKIHIDGRIIAKTPATFTIAPSKQKVIVGKI